LFNARDRELLVRNEQTSVMKILLAVDGSAYTKRMLGYLGGHEDLFSASAEYTAMTVVAAVPPQVTHFIDKHILNTYFLDEAQKILTPVHAFAKKYQRNVTMLHRVGDAADLIAETATSGKFDLLIMGSHGYSGVKSLLLGSVSSRVMALCATPTLIIR
jgi:nucleotide-binding universal stress UspA family protein